MPAIDIHLCGKGELIGWPEAEVSHHVTDGLRVAIVGRHGSLESWDADA